MVACLSRGERMKEDFLLLGSRVWEIWEIWETPSVTCGDSFLDEEALEAGIWKLNLIRAPSPLTFPSKQRGRLGKGRALSYE